MEVLNEKALRPDVLKDLIHPIISVDEYTPKLNPDNIVVQFQVLDNFDAAYDLSSFLERSPENILDTEASETPNIDGRYNVFIEVERNNEFPDRLVKILSDLDNVAPGIDWKLQLYKVNDPVDLDVKSITEEMTLSTEEDLKEFFNYSNCEIQLNEDKSFQVKNVYGVKLNYSSVSNVMNESLIKTYLSDECKLDNTQLSPSLSSQYTVMRIDEGFIVSYKDKFVILK